MVRILDNIGAFVLMPVVIAGFRDIAARIIPDSAIVVIAVLGLSSRIEAGPEALAASAAAATVLFGILVLLHAGGAIGGGDVKLMSAIALGFSIADTERFVFSTAMAGGVLALLHLIARLMLRGRPRVKPPARGAALLRRVWSAERWRIARHGSLPYGVAIGCGAIRVIIGAGGH